MILLDGLFGILKELGLIWGYLYIRMDVLADMIKCNVAIRGTQQLQTLHSQCRSNGSWEMLP
jgi:hypothetical protein